jgi:hypothetical protein
LVAAVQRLRLTPSTTTTPFLLSPLTTQDANINDAGYRKRGPDLQAKKINIFFPDIKLNICVLIKCNEFSKSH